MILVAVKRDRLARDTMNAAMIERLAERAGAQVLTCDGAGDGIHLLDQADEQDVIRIARALHTAGLSSRGFAARLAVQGLYSRVGTVFTSSSIRAMVAGSA